MIKELLKIKRRRYVGKGNKANRLNIIRIIEEIRSLEDYKRFLEEHNICWLKVTIIDLYLIHLYKYFHDSSK